MTADLDETSCFGEIDRGVADRGEKDGVYKFIVAEIFKDGHSFLLGGCAVDECSFEVFCVCLECIDVIREDDDFVPSFLMVVD